MTDLLEVASLDVRFQGGLHPVRALSFSVAAGETLGIVGESGSGKSLTALALLGLLPPGAQRRAERLRFAGQDLDRLGERQMADLRGRRISMIFQDPMTSLNPSYTIGNQLEETYRRHLRASRSEARERAADLLAQVGIGNVAERLDQYPHQLSGGLRQRVMIAMALICGPDLLIADEPTTALDVTTQAEILQLLQSLQQKFRTALIMITHDMGIVARMAARVMVMYAGQAVETAPAAELFAAPLHPYTRALLACVPVPGRTARGTPLGAIPGTAPHLAGDLQGCHFRDRCAMAHAACAPEPIALRMLGPGRGFRCVLPTGWIAAERQAGPPVAAEPARSTAPVLEVRELRHTYQLSRGAFRARRSLHAVDGVDLTLHKGETLGLVGESGCGKSTLAAMLLGLTAPTGGRILLDGKQLDEIPRIALARRIQPVFQDPYSSLNPSKTVSAIIGLPLRIHSLGEADGRRLRVREAMEWVGLPPRFADRHPAQLSGGQRQRVAIARALVMRPEIVICDEPTSALDVSVQAQILNLLQALQRELGLTYLLISHNLAVVEHMATRVAVMYQGRIVEQGATEDIFARPGDAYTRRLLASVLTPIPDAAAAPPRAADINPLVA